MGVKINLMDKTMIIDFEITQNGYTLRDALLLPDDHTLTDAEIEAMKQQRFDNWYTIITTPVENPNPEAPVEEIGNG
jgi:hypothetical protein